MAYGRWEELRKNSLFCGAVILRNVFALAACPSLLCVWAGERFADTTASYYPPYKLHHAYQIVAAAVSRNSQSTRLRPRSLVWRNPATS